MPTPRPLAPCLSLGLVLAAILPGPAVAQERPGPLTLSAHQVKPGVYWVDGGVSNTGFVVGDKGVIAIDAQKTGEAANAALAEIAKVTAQKVDTVIVTHSDPDHVGGLPAYPAGTQIIAQENTRAAILASAADPAAPPVYAGLYGKLAASYLPSHLVGQSESVTIDGIRMQLIYVAPAHSSGDLVIYLPEKKVVFAGDIVTTNTGRFPVIHIGGSSLGWIATMKAILALDADTIISGHGEIWSRDKLTAWLHLVEERRDAIKAMVMQNKSIEEVQAALPDVALAPMFPTFTQTTYRELVKGYPAEARGPWVNLVHKP